MGYIGEDGGLRDPTGTTVARRGSPPVALLGRCCPTEYWQEERRGPEDEDEDDEDIGLSPVEAPRLPGEDGSAQGAGVHSG